RSACWKLRFAPSRAASRHARTSGGQRHKLSSRDTRAAEGRLSLVTGEVSNCSKPMITLLPLPALKATVSETGSRAILAPTNEAGVHFFDAERIIPGAADNRLPP